MRASEFINEMNVGLGTMLGMATKKLSGTSNLSKFAPKLTAAMGGTRSPSTMASIIAKSTKNGSSATTPTKPGSIKSYTAQKTAEPPQQAAGTVTQQSQQLQQVKTGDTINIPNIGPSKVLKTAGATVTVQPDPKDPDTTITTDKKKLGLM